MSPIRDSMGRVVAVSAMARDMTLQNKLWQTARESEDVFIRLMENSPEPFMISRDGIWVYGNNAALQLLGAAGKDQVIGKSVYDFIHPQGHETVRRRLACAEKGNIKGLIEQKMIRLDGTVIHVETVTIPAMFEGKPSIHTVIRDVTERKKAEEVLRTSDKLKAAGQMAAGIAHEIRNPLTAIKGFIQLAEWRLPDKVEYFSIIKEEIERIERITSELLMLAKPNPGKVQKTDIRQILQGVKALLETQAIMNKIEIVTELQETPAYIECDENQIKQVFINLIKNAIEAMKQGGTITVSVRCEDGKVLAEVADQGCGIPQEQLLKIGQPFYTTKDKGTGLGLMVSFKIIENHHGSISISSRSGEGTTFTIALPLACGQT
jgi:two-component system sporulation sensor kinase A